MRNKPQRKCENCKYCYSSGYSYPEWNCEIFGQEDIPDKYLSNDKEGCNLHWKTIQKMINADEKVLARQYELYGEGMTIIDAERDLYNHIYWHKKINIDSWKNTLEHIKKTKAKDLIEQRNLKHLIRKFEILIYNMEDVNKELDRIESKNGDTYNCYYFEKIDEEVKK